jgi:hypothetical protein
MTVSQCDSIGRLSLCATAVESEDDRPLSTRSALLGAMDPENTRVGPVGGDVDPLLNMAPSIGTNRANAMPAFSAAFARQTAQLAWHLQPR